MALHAVTLVMLAYAVMRETMRLKLLVHLGFAIGFAAVDLMPGWSHCLYLEAQLEIFDSHGDCQDVHAQILL
jgi:hypothetical protein